MTTKSPQTDLSRELAALAPLHFVGVNGSGMRPLAEFTESFGCAVTGSDITPVVTGSRVVFAAEDSTENRRLIAEAKTIVFSSAIAENHPTLIEAQLTSKTTIHRSLLLARMTSAFKTITVAGTHGKTTTSALVAHGLQQLGMDPSWIIGAPFADGRRSYHRGKSDLLVVEADESDGSFLRYSPFIAILNNIESPLIDFWMPFPLS
jgi:UDP-N-acetylmuramate--alanine ligase